MSISAYDYAMMQMRIRRSNIQRETIKDAVENEGDLHDEIMDECNRRGWIAFHGSMAHRAHRTEGEPDFIIFADAGRVFAVECKSRTGKLSTAQLGIIAWAKKLGHTVYVVQSMSEFLECVK